MAESFGLSFGIIGERAGPSRITRNTPQISLHEAINIIGFLPISQDQKNDLSEIVKKSPNGSLGQILSNYRVYLKKP